MKRVHNIPVLIGVLLLSACDPVPNQHVPDTISINSVQGSVGFSQAHPASSCYQLPPTNLDRGFVWKIEGEQITVSFYQHHTRDFSCGGIDPERNVWEPTRNDSILMYSYTATVTDEGDASVTWESGAPTRQDNNGSLPNPVMATKLKYLVTINNGSTHAVGDELKDVLFVDDTDQFNKLYSGSLTSGTDIDGYPLALTW